MLSWCTFWVTYIDTHSAKGRMHRIHKKWRFYYSCCCVSHVYVLKSRLNNRDLKRKRRRFPNSRTKVKTKRKTKRKTTFSSFTLHLWCPVYWFLRGRARHVSTKTQRLSRKMGKPFCKFEKSSLSPGIEPGSRAWQAQILTTILTKTWYGKARSRVNTFMRNVSRWFQSYFRVIDITFRD